MTLLTMKAGDRVRITVEGQVFALSHDGVQFRIDGSRQISSPLWLIESELTAPTARVEALPPPIDPDLVLAREVVAEWFEPSSTSRARHVRDGVWDDDADVQLALAAIKAAKAGGRV